MNSIETSEYSQFKYLLKRFVKQANVNILKQNNRSPTLGSDGFENNQFEYCKRKQMDVLHIGSVEFHVHLKVGSSYGPRNGNGSVKAPYIDYELEQKRCCNIRVVFVESKIQKIKVVIWHSDKGDDQTTVSAMIDELDLFSDLQSNEYLINFYNQFMNFRDREPENLTNEIEDKLITTLKNNYNIILRGAPGTGKTFLAQQIAANLISNGRTANIEHLTPEESKQLGFVQFHPSYDYTDFVEGLRPSNLGTEVGFELKPGIFKSFCARASKSTINAVDNFEQSWAKFVKKMDEEQEIEVEPRYTYHPSESWETVGGIMRTTDKGYNQYINKTQLYNVYRGLPGVPRGGHDNFRKKVLLFMKEHLGLLNYKAGEGSNDKPYVFIIDEINRGEISKIFGELFFSLDPGYRGPKGGVLTQYSNLHEDKDEKFFIPQNVYIIGTMNDIDRSVDTFDFAMRRRFTFIEISAEQSAKHMLKNDETKALMTRINDAIIDKTKGGLTKDYQIGASYFLTIDEEGTSSEAIRALWDNKLFPLLTDYFRGEHESERKLKYLEDAYFAMPEED